MLGVLRREDTDRPRASLGAGLRRGGGGGCPSPSPAPVCGCGEATPGGRSFRTSSPTRGLGQDPAKAQPPGWLLPVRGPRMHVSAPPPTALGKGGRAAGKEAGRRHRALDSWTLPPCAGASGTPAPPGSGGGAAGLSPGRPGPSGSALYRPSRPGGRALGASPSSRPEEPPSPGPRIPAACTAVCPSTPPPAPAAPPPSCGGAPVPCPHLASRRTSPGHRGQPATPPVPCEARPALPAPPRSPARHPPRTRDGAG